MGDELELKRLLDAIDWESFAIQLMARAVRVARWYVWNSGGIDLLGEGNTPQDIVQRVILKAYSGKRTKPAGMDVKVWLLGQIRSEIDNLYRKFSHQKEFSVLEVSEDDTVEEIQDFVEFMAMEDGVFPNAKPLTPEQELLKQESINEQYNAIFDAIYADSELEQLVDAINVVGSKPQDLAAALNQPVKQINNSLRRLRRRLESRIQNEQ